MSLLVNQQEINGTRMPTLRKEMIARLDESLCNGCRLCLPVCNFNALIWVRSDNELLLDHWACNGCGTCVTACPTDALSLRPRVKV
jgi:heterodisulfide reductase subunit A